MMNLEKADKRKLSYYALGVVFYSLVKIAIFMYFPELQEGELELTLAGIFAVTDFLLLLAWARLGYVKLKEWKQAGLVFFYLHIAFFIALLLAIIFHFLGQYGRAVSGALVVMFFFMPCYHLLLYLSFLLAQPFTSFTTAVLGFIALLIFSGAGMFLAM